MARVKDLRKCELAALLAVTLLWVFHAMVEGDITCPPAQMGTFWASCPTSCVMPFALSSAATFITIFN